MMNANRSIFDVTVDGKLVFSKFETGRHIKDNSRQLIEQAGFWEYYNAQTGASGGMEKSAEIRVGPAPASPKTCRHSPIWGCAA